MNSTGNRIKKIRLSKGMTQSKFAESINKKEQTNKISKGTINNWEHDRNLPNKERLKIIAKIGQTSIFYLLNGDVEEDNKIDNRIEMNKNTEKSNIRLTNIINNRQKELKMSSKELAKKLKLQFQRFIDTRKRDLLIQRLDI
ncbi:helix-turn-helix domain-containing protein [Apilactobacillus micheneri]|uniref:helix-turn-helix domain-containing protein n=1 Tax=Apilactobacillus micheneri TaxID=1899430 RepID=UPI000D02D5ED|nr:helix-turn-helix transcriptional regulator [Apilactobacillus micheneri]